MAICNSEEIIIHGTTSKGKVFRPSDWAERLCGILSSFTKDNRRLSYSEWVQPVLLDKIRSVAIHPQLAEINPPMFRFLMDFAADNDLRVMKCAELLAEQNQNKSSVTHIQEEPERVSNQNNVVEQQAKTTSETLKNIQNEEKNGVKSINIVLREIEAHETAAAFAALSVLRPKLQDRIQFVEQVNQIQRKQGYRLLGIFEEGHSNAVAVCGFRQSTNLVSGCHIHIDDLVTIPQFRKRGYGTKLLEEVQRIAQNANIAEIHIDSNVGGERTTAHRIYFQHNFEIIAYHFVCDLTENK